MCRSLRRWTSFVWACLGLPSHNLAFLACPNLSVAICANLGISGFLLACLGITHQSYTLCAGCVWACPVFSGLVCTCLGLFGSAKAVHSLSWSFKIPCACMACQGLSRLVWSCLGLSGLVWACLSLYGLAWACLGMSAFVFACQGLSGLV
jgi:hypothetical protein